MRSTSYQVMKMQQQEHARGKSCAVEPCLWQSNGNERMGRKRKNEKPYSKEAETGKNMTVVTIGL